MSPFRLASPQRSEAIAEVKPSGSGRFFVLLPPLHAYQNPVLEIWGKWSLVQHINERNTVGARKRQIGLEQSGHGRNVCFLDLNAPLLIVTGSFPGSGADSRCLSFIHAGFAQVSLRCRTLQRSTQTLMFPHSFDFQDIYLNRRIICESL